MNTITAPPEITADEIVFHTSPREPIEDRTRLHVWLIDLDDHELWQTPEGTFPAHEYYLSTEEQTRAGRLRNPRTREIWWQSRTILRHILGLCLNVPPQDIHFAETEHGKLTVVQPAGAESSASRFDFSLAHSSNLLLIGLSFDSQIGVDIEIIDNGFDVLSIAESHFTRAESAQLAALPAEARPRAFFDCWTLKEAVLKAHGVGISAGLDAIELSLDACATPRIVNSRIDATGLETAVYQQTVTIGAETAAMSICELRGTPR